MTLMAEDKIHDDLQDDIGLILRQLEEIPTWTKRKFELFSVVCAKAKTEKYKGFRGDCRQYHLQRVGSHCLYDVPSKQRGALAVFAGMRVRLICGGRWDQYSGRYYYAKAIK